MGGSIKWSICMRLDRIPLEKCANDVHYENFCVCVLNAWKDENKQVAALFVHPFKMKFISNTRLSVSWFS